jgi:hypothetical protein
LNHPHVCARLPAPDACEYFRANAPDEPLPDAGVEESEVTRPGAVAGTVQLPNVCQPLFAPPASAAYM